jgi:hypothetical protein
VAFTIATNAARRKHGAGAERWVKVDLRLVDLDDRPVERLLFKPQLA